MRPYVSSRGAEQPSNRAHGRIESRAEQGNEGLVGAFGQRQGHWVDQQHAKHSRGIVAGTDRPSTRKTTMVRRSPTPMRTSVPKPQAPTSAMPTPKIRPPILRRQDRLRRSDSGARQLDEAKLCKYLRYEQVTNAQVFTMQSLRIPQDQSARLATSDGKHVAIMWELRDNTKL